MHTYLRFDACVELQKHLNTFPTYDLLKDPKGQKAFPLASQEPESTPLL